MNTLTTHSASLPPVFTYEELGASTNHFDSKRTIGDGGLGSVYLGQLYDGRLVAMKHLHKHNSAAVGREKGFSMKSFCNEILILSSINHPNVVKLHEYCSDPEACSRSMTTYLMVLLLIISMASRVCTRKGPSTRVDIALQTALAIEYLHFSVVPPVVHRDITSANIFVDKDMRVKVGNFRLSRLFGCTIASSKTSEGIWTGPQGTPGYLDPDYYRSFRLNEISNIYSFGVVLLELITGMRAIHQSREMRELILTDMVVPMIQMGLLHQVVDPVLVVDEEAMEGATTVTELAFRCVAANKDDRPDAWEVATTVAELAFRCVAANKDDRPDAWEVAMELRRIKGSRKNGGSGLLSSNSSNELVPDGVGAF